MAVVLCIGSAAMAESPAVSYSVLRNAAAVNQESRRGSQKPEASPELLDRLGDALRAMYGWDNVSSVSHAGYTQHVHFLPELSLAQSMGLLHASAGLERLIVVHLLNLPPPALG